MDPTARIILDKLDSFERRISRLEERLDALVPQQKQHSSPHRDVRLQSFEVSNVENVFFHYKDRSFTDMQLVLDQLIAAIPFKKARRRKVQIYAEFVSGRPDMHVEGSQIGDGFKILLFVAVPGVTTITDNLYRDANYDAQVIITLDGSFRRIDFKKSDREVQKFTNAVNA